jgi:hypothetical protein
VWDQVLIGRVTVTTRDGDEGQGVDGVVNLTGRHERTVSDLRHQVKTQPRKFDTENSARRYKTRASIKFDLNGPLA